MPETGPSQLTGRPTMWPLHEDCVSPPDEYNQRRREDEQWYVEWCEEWRSDDDCRD